MIEKGLIETQQFSPEILFDLFKQARKFKDIGNTDKQENKTLFSENSVTSIGNGAVEETETDPGNVDTDGDGIQDGTESGLDTPQSPDTDPAVFVSDADSWIVTVKVSISVFAFGRRNFCSVFAVFAVYRNVNGIPCVNVTPDAVYTPFTGVTVVESAVQKT